MIPLMTAHLVCGDYAQKTVRALLGKWAHIIVLRDDLAVGPLADVDEIAALERERFWLDVIPTDKPIYAQLAKEVAFYQILPQYESCVVWAGNDCAEQLMLRRVAFYTLGGEKRLFLVDARGDGKDKETKSSIALFTPEQLMEKARHPRLLTPLEQQYLAGEWQAVKKNGQGLRFWRHQRIEPHPLDALDGRIAARIGQEWQAVPNLVADMMKETPEFFVTDAFLLWRLRLMKEAGSIEWLGEDRLARVRAASAS